MILKVKRILFSFLLIQSFVLALLVAVTDVSESAMKNCSGLQSRTKVDGLINAIQLDEKCRTVYIEAPSSTSDSSYTGASTVVSETFDPNTAFQLHSKPDAPSIIYLDFDGQTWGSNSWWVGGFGILAGRVSEGYSLDSDSQTFSTIERQNIYEVWTMVAEDFAMFNVDVTTERPTGAREDVFLVSGSHALILQDNSVQEACGCGGVAHFDVFETDSPWDRPALNFSRFGTTVVHPIDIAEIISHEVGHNLGLAHDGTTTDVEYYGGHAMWTPIMGAGRGRGIATWSNGGYPFAMTRWEQRGGDDDFLQMSNYLQLNADEYGDNKETAFSLSQQELLSPIPGQITTREDIDFLQFEVTKELAGRYEILLNPISYGPNLDPELKLLNSTGAELASSNPGVFVPQPMTYITSGMDASISFVLDPGTYLLRVDGVGQGSISDATGYDDYASVGNYSIVFKITSFAPKVSKVTPAKITAGKRIVIRGSNLDQVKVFLGKKVLKQISVSSTKIIVIAPKVLKGNTFMLRIEGKHLEIKREVKRK